MEATRTSSTSTSAAPMPCRLRLLMLSVAVGVLGPEPKNRKTRGGRRVLVKAAASPPVEDLVERRPAKGPRIAGARAFEATPCPPTFHLSPTWAPVSGPLSSPCASHGWAACCPGLLAEALEFDEPWAAAADQENETYNQIGEPYGLSLELTNGIFSGWTTCPGLLAEALEFNGESCTATRGQTAEPYCPTGDICGPTLVPRYVSSVKRPLPKICAPRKRRCTLRHRLMRVNGTVRCKPPALGSLRFRPPPLGGSPVWAASLCPSHLTELHPAADCCPPALLGTLGCSPSPVGGSPVFDATLCTSYPGTPAVCDARQLLHATGLEPFCCTCGLHAQEVQVGRKAQVYPLGSLCPAEAPIRKLSPLRGRPPLSAIIYAVILAGCMLEMFAAMVVQVGRKTQVHPRLLQHLAEAPTPAPHS